MKKEIIQTADGSHTVSIPELKVTYHSIHGAIRESVHVFIEAGLSLLLDSKPGEEIRVFEMGFGTGLNAFLSAIAGLELKRKIHYTAIENAPLTDEEVKTLNYPEELGYAELFRTIHSCKWATKERINDYFSLYKVQTNFFNFSAAEPFSLVYYDAFAPSAQPELWTKEVFARLQDMLVPSGILTTYCSKGDVRRAMAAAGFTVTKLPGPPGKREMLRGKKS